MGRRVPEPIPPDPVPAGELCSVCWGPGGIFGDGPTPSQITVEIDGVSRGPNWIPADGEPPNGSFDLPQLLDAGPCVFDVVGAVNLSAIFDVASTVVNGSVTGGFAFFDSNPAAPCVKVLTSNLGDHFAGGTATIILPEVEA